MANRRLLTLSPQSALCRSHSRVNTDDKYPGDRWGGLYRQPRGEGVGASRVPAGRPTTISSTAIDGRSNGGRWSKAISAIGRPCSAAIERYDIAAVVHFAAFAYVGESMVKPELYFQNNVVKSLTLLDVMRRRRPICRFSSTCATYGTPDRMPITEETPQRPVNPYGETKLMIERAIHWFGQAHGITAVPLRYFNAAGADAEGEIGEDHRPETHLIPLILDAALGRRPAIDILGTDYDTRDGSCVRDYIHVTDLADAHVGALALSDGWRRLGGAQPRHRLRSYRQGGDRRGRAGDRPQGAAARKCPAGPAIRRCLSPIRRGQRRRWAGIPPISTWTRSSRRPGTGMSPTTRPSPAPRALRTPWRI